METAVKIELKKNTISSLLLIMGMMMRDFIFGGYS